MFITLSAAPLAPEPAEGLLQATRQSSQNYCQSILGVDLGRMVLNRHHYERETCSGRPCRPDQGRTLLAL